VSSEHLAMCPPPYGPPPHGPDMFSKVMELLVLKLQGMGSGKLVETFMHQWNQGTVQLFVILLALYFLVLIFVSLEEVKMDPKDGELCTYETVVAKYKNGFKPHEIEHYWKNTMTWKSTKALKERTKGMTTSSRIICGVSMIAMLSVAYTSWPAITAWFGSFNVLQGLLSKVPLKYRVTSSTISYLQMSEALKQNQTIAMVVGLFLLAWPLLVYLLENGETVSVDGNHLGHNLPDMSGNRYCINLVSVAGHPEKPKDAQLTSI